MQNSMMPNTETEQTTYLVLIWASALASMARVVCCQPRFRLLGSARSLAASRPRSRRYTTRANASGGQQRASRFRP